MPEDLKQLEAAARAAGYAFRADVTRIGVWATHVDGHPWNPRDDDGDALRLAVDLCLNIEFGNDGADYTAAWDGCIGSGKWYHHASDRRTATRWAILTVAAMAESPAVGAA